MNSITWPPRSPHEALLSSPSGRRMQDRSSPSPLKTRAASRQTENSDEDEETLQLRLEAIETRLKLKKLQRVKSSGPFSTLNSRASPGCKAVQVAVSPRNPAPKESLSPRKALGIDKGLKGKDVSLRRVPVRDPTGPFASTRPGDTLPDGSARPKTFSQRIAESRQQEKEKEKNRLRKQRSTGFGVQQQDLDAFKDGSIAPVTYSSETCRGFSRDEVLAAPRNPFGHSKSNKPSVSESSTQETSRTGTSHPPSESHSLEPFSSIHLSKRLIPHAFLSNTLAQKHISLIPSLLASIKSPAYTLPESLESDFVVLGIIASKSSPLSHKDAKGQTEATSITEATNSDMNVKGKYMVFTLTDLKWTIDLYIFTTAYTRFWKLTPGTLIAILNPSIMPPPPGKADTGRFSLVLNSSDDTILEIGTSRDLGWCKSIKRDGKSCGSWVDKRHTEFCEWHVDRAVETTRRGRMEVNGMSAPFAPGGKSRGRTGFWSKGEGQWDRGTESRYFIGPSLGSRNASLLDEGLERGGTKEERVRKRLAERQREKEIARKLGEGGNGIGREYLRLRHEATVETKRTETVDAASLGLLGNQAGNVHLSPLKRKAGELDEMKRKADESDGMRKKTRFMINGIEEVDDLEIV